MKKILIVFGGKSYEHDVSIKSAKNLYNYIDKKIFEVNTLYISRDNIWYETNNNFEDLEVSEIYEIDNVIKYIKQYDLVINIIHGNTGEDGKLESLFELFDINYIGSNSISSVLCMNKDLTKIVLDNNNIKQVNYLLFKNIKDMESKLDYPVIVKPNNGGSSIGMGIAYNRKELKDILKIAKNYSDIVIIEKFIENNRELECSVIQKNKKIYVSTIGEIIPSNSFYDYDDKYEKNEANMIIPASLSKEINKEIKDIAKKAFTVLNCKDFARIDFLIDKKDNSIYLNEINTIPGFTDISMFTKLLEYDKFNIKDLITSLINNSIH